MKILFLNGEQAGREYVIPDNGASIGRETDNDLQLLVGGVSRYHARIVLEDSSWYISDLGSTNGTKVNGQKISGRTQLHVGDLFVIGNQKFRFESTPQAEKPADGQKPAPIPSPEPEVKAVEPEKAETPGQTPPVFVFRPMDLAEEKTASPDGPEDLAENTEKAGLFGGFKFGGGATEKTEEKKSRPLFSGKYGNLLFYVLIAAAAVIVISVFLNAVGKNDQRQEASVSRPKSLNPFLLVYEKSSVSAEGIFRFKCTIEKVPASKNVPKNDLYTLEAMVDEPVLERQYIMKMELNYSDIKELETKLQSSEFMRMEQPMLAGGTENDRTTVRLIISCGNDFNDVTIRNSASQEIRSVEEILSDFFSEPKIADGKVSIMMKSSEELKTESLESLASADQLYKTLDTHPENLPKAIAYYQIAVNGLGQFSPLPESYEKAVRGLESATKKMEDIRKNGSSKINLYIQKRMYQDAIRECERIMQIFPPESETYTNAKKLKIKIQRVVKGENK